MARHSRQGAVRHGRLSGWLRWIVAAVLLLMLLAGLLNGGRRPSTTPRPPAARYGAGAWVGSLP